MARWALQNFAQVGDSIASLAEGRFDPQGGIPPRPRQGQLQYVDGVGWVRTDGQGFYFFNGTYWVPMKMYQQNVMPMGNFDTNPWQWGTSFPAAPNTGTTADGWRFNYTTSGVVTVSKAASAPTVLQCGFLAASSLEALVTTADVAVAAADFVGFQYAIEGYNFRQLAGGAVALGFWHQHSKVGTYCVGLRNLAGDQSCVQEYTQLVSNAWEYAEVVFPGSPSAGGWDYAISVGVYVTFMLMVGSALQTPPGVWAAGTFLGTANQVNAMDTVNNRFRIALAGVYRGETAPKVYPYLSRADVLVHARRYLRIFSFPAGGATIALGQCTAAGAASFPMLLLDDGNEMRSPAPVIFSSAAAAFQATNAAGAGIACTGITLVTNTGGVSEAAVTVAAGLVAGNATILETAPASPATFILSAEL